MNEVSILIIPGLSGSGAEHWQTAWEKHEPNMQRVEQNNWEEPQLTEWLHTLLVHSGRVNQSK